MSTLQSKIWISISLYPKPNVKILDVSQRRTEGDLFDERSRGGKSLRLSVKDIVQRTLTARMWYQSTRRESHKKSVGA
jgi:hypothetical protein